MNNRATDVRSSEILFHRFDMNNNNNNTIYSEYPYALWHNIYLVSNIKYKSCSVPEEVQVLFLTLAIPRILLINPLNPKLV
jgi:hypothetical protein